MAKMIQPLALVSFAAFLLLGFILAGLNFRALTFYIVGAVAIIVGLGVFTAGYWKAMKDGRHHPSRPNTSTAGWTGAERRTAARG